MILIDSRTTVYYTPAATLTKGFTAHRFTAHNFEMYGSLDKKMICVKFYVLYQIRNVEAVNSTNLYNNKPTNNHLTDRVPPT